jgi:putative transposase
MACWAGEARPTSSLASMKINPGERHRRSIRLKGYDYSQPGAYFVTICTHNKVCVFGEIVDGQMRLNTLGQMIQAEWLKIGERFPTMQMDEFVVMPNHFHAIINIVGATLVVAPNDHPDLDTTRAGTSPAPTPTTTTAHTASTVGDIVGAFESITTHAYILWVRAGIWPEFDQRLWQRNYYEHVIRDMPGWQRIQAYIRANPVTWESDRLKPGGTN